MKAEIIDINTQARPIALPLLAALLGLVNGYRMTRLPGPRPSAAAESVFGA